MTTYQLFFQQLGQNQFDYLFLAISYFLGAIPFGYLITRIFLGFDIRQSGSGNIGMTNVIRAGGKIPGIATFLLDFFKGTLAVFLPTYYNASEIAILLCALLAVFGHTKPVFLKFKGGKGVATNLGVWVLLDWRIFLAAAGSWVLIFLWKKISSLSALISLIILPIVAYFLYPREPMFALSLILTLYIIYLHHDNIRRLIKGDEKVLSTAPKN
ncbi:MAG: glycerol-3-phosphate 1-O-acyltransferase PlsY [Deltaproteobacteria bacterium]|nr:glycerol-3-phosphate 1-O-acyltransferase PlsY [Deltaproteobacteria bacterium]